MEEPNLAYVKPKAKVCMDEGEAMETFVDSCLASDNSCAFSDPRSMLDGRVRYVDGILSRDECARLRERLDASPLLSFWSPVDEAEVRAYRDADTVEVHSIELSRRLWARCGFILGPLLPPVPVALREEDGGDVWERELAGSTWVPCGLNHDLLFARYPSGGAFAPHTDGRTCHTFNRRSFDSVIIFLNDVPEGKGGGTRFYSQEALTRLHREASDGIPKGRWSADPSFVTAEVAAVSGRVLVFDQQLVHEGIPPAPGYRKYILRTDVMYDREVPLCNSRTEVEAYALYQRAEALAEEPGGAFEAARLMARALKMAPVMAAVMGMAT